MRHWCIEQFMPAGTGEQRPGTTPKAPHTSLLQVFPKWLRVARLWFEGVRRYICFFVCSCSRTNSVYNVGSIIQ